MNAWPWSHLENRGCGATLSSDSVGFKAQVNPWHRRRSGLGQDTRRLEQLSDALAFLSLNLRCDRPKFTWLVEKNTETTQFLPSPHPLLVSSSRCGIAYSLSFSSSTFTPLIFSAIFFASNGRYKISYIDALFNCVSAMTVCGLATVDLSELTGWQQTILFIQMCLGSPVYSLFASKDPFFLNGS